MTIWHGKYADSTQDWLRWCDRQGRALPTAEERAAKAEERAGKAKERADKLAAQLRALGIKPEA
jgi:hypothetical protein